MFGRLYLAVLAAASLVSGSAIDLQTRQSQGKPSVDPFYRPPSGFAASAPGTILRSRKITNLQGFSYQSAFQLLYRTTDSLGNPTSTVTTVIIPKNADLGKFVSYQIFYDSVAVDCAPSYTLTRPFSLQIDDGVKTLLDAGFVVSTPDYEGPLAQFTAGVISGQATLDAVRAALRSTSITGIKSTAKYAMWGYSGGALASEYAAELNPTYAPELKFAGIALGGLTPNVRTVAFTINKGPFAGLLPSGVLGLASAYPDTQTTLNTELLPDKAAAFNAAKTRCLPEQIAAGAGQDYSKYFRSGLAAIDSPASQRATAAGGIMGLKGTPQANLYVYKGVLDEVSPVNETDALVKKYCQAGVKIQYKRDIANGHLREQIFGKNDALDFVKKSLNGGLFFSNCFLNSFTA